MNRFTIILMLLFQSISFIVVAEERKFEGICGYKFGQVISSGYDGTFDDGFRFKNVFPQKKFMSFDKYALVLTPKTLKVCAFLMKGDIDSSNEFEKVDKVLESYYGIKGEDLEVFIGKEKNMF